LCPISWNHDTGDNAESPEIHMNAADGSGPADTLPTVAMPVNSHPPDGKTPPLVMKLVWSRGSTITR